MTLIHSGKAVGPEQHHRGHVIRAWHYGPDCLCLVDGRQVGNFYLSAEAARQAGVRHVDQLEEERSSDE